MSIVVSPIDSETNLTSSQKQSSEKSQKLPPLAFKPSIMLGNFNSLFPDLPGVTLTQ